MKFPKDSTPLLFSFLIDNKPSPSPLPPLFLLDFITSLRRNDSIFHCSDRYPEQKCIVPETSVIKIEIYVKYILGLLYKSVNNVGGKLRKVLLSFHNRFSTRSWIKVEKNLILDSATDILRVFFFGWYLIRYIFANCTFLNKQIYPSFLKTLFKKTTRCNDNR